MDWLTTYQRALGLRWRDPVLLTIAVITLLIGVVNVQTSISDAANLGRELSPLKESLGEYTSIFIIILMLAPVFAFFDTYPITRQNWQKRAVPYLGASVAFSLVHVSLMVLVRKLLWPMLIGGSYEFFDEDYDAAFYEYRKDLVTFLLCVLVWELQRQIRQAKSSAAQAADPITLKSGATTILLQPAEFLYAKSAGNYAEVTSLSGTQLARITLTELAELLNDKGCNAVRIHRSVIVNRGAIMETAPIAGGDLTVKLRGGETLRASRRFKNAL
ncbi:MAG: LytTR family transcriptional regulator [Kordiimonadaceae bacterium]|nr:LytTR family transcriptional regulator [Kordiimonadaceae bacterium]MBO6568534.1 LytTR family transcriptional regulator [Kordiimonadaceae bacterium]MBO6963737.1 LytTR family transcriptional regulator [Kordiimonadaceae bacterium]